MGLILLDNQSRGSTTLLAQIVNSSGTVIGSTSDQLAVGTTLGDDSGDMAFNAGRKLKQWAADANSMFADQYFTAGNCTHAVLLSGNTDNYSPNDTGGGSNYQAGMTRWMIITPTDSTSTLLGLAAAPNGWGMWLINPHPSIPWTIENAASGTPGNDLYCPNGVPFYMEAQSKRWVMFVAAMDGWLL